MNQWLEVAKLDDIPSPGAGVVVFGYLNIALFRTVDNRVFAFEDSCMNRGELSSQCSVQGSSSCCPVHNRKYDLASGEGIAPNQDCSNHFPVKVADDRIYISLDRQTAAA